MSWYISTACCRVGLLFGVLGVVVVRFEADPYRLSIAPVAFSYQRRPSWSYCWNCDTSRYLFVDGKCQVAEVGRSCSYYDGGSVEWLGWGGECRPATSKPLVQNRLSVGSRVLKYEVGEPPIKCVQQERKGMTEQWCKCSSEVHLCLLNSFNHHFATE